MDVYGVWFADAIQKNSKLNAFESQEIKFMVWLISLFSYSASLLNVNHHFLCVGKTPHSLFAGLHSDFWYIC